MKSLDASAHVTSSKSDRRRKHERRRYTVQEDLVLIKFVKEHVNCCPMKGNILYKKAEKAKITSHSWQSMRKRYLKYLQNKEHADLYIRTGTLKSFVGEKKKVRREETDNPSTHNTTVDKDEGRVTRAQATKRQEKIDSQNKCDTEEEQERMTRSKTSKENEKIGSRNKSLETDFEDKIDDTSEDTGQEWIPRCETSRAKPKIGDKDKHLATDDTEDTNADYLPDEARADNTDDENSAAEDVDYDKIFDDNLLKQAYEYKKKRDSSEVKNDVAEDQDVDEDSRVSSSQEMVNRAITRNEKRPVNEEEKLSDFDGEIVFRKDFKSPSAKKSNSEDEEDNKKPMAKRSKRDFESLSDDENPSEKEQKLQEAFFKFYNAFQSNLQV